MTYTRPARTLRNGHPTGVPRGVGDVWDDLDAYFNAPPTVDPSQVPPGDQVNQTAGGGTTTSAADFTVVGGVCKPTNFPALAAVRAFQGQLNRVAQMKGFTKIAADGSVGPATLTLFRQVQSVAAGSVMGDGSSCMGVAPDVDVLAAQIAALADGLGAPATVSGALTLRPPTIVTKSGLPVAAPDAGLTAELAKLSGIEKIAIVGLGGAILYLTLGRHGKRKRRK